MGPRIAVVGAGIAGLNAALSLRQAGLPCAVYEASNRIGGRMHSDGVTWADGTVSEWCGEFIGSDHTNIHQLIRRFGLDTITLDQGNAGRTPSLVYLFDHFYGADELARDLEALAPLVRQQMQEAGFPTTHDHFTEAGFALDHQSAFAWIEQHVAGGHATPLGHFLDVMCTGFYGLNTDEQSSLNLVYLVGSLDLSSGQASPRPMQGSSRIAGGNQRLPLAIARSLPDECIHLGHRLVALERAADTTLTLTFATAGGPAHVSCDYAILTLPFSSLRRVDYRQAGFDPLKRAAIEQLGYGTNSKLFLQLDTPYWYDEGPWPHPHSGFLITDLDILAVWDASRGQPSSHGLLVDYTGGHRGAAYAPPTAYTPADDSAGIQPYAQHCLRELERVFPGISAHYTGKAALSYPTGDPHLLGSYSCWRVGQYTQFGGYEGVRQGHVLFAGEHCSIDFQGFMEGAVREGARAAGEIVQDLHSGQART